MIDYLKDKHKFVQHEGNVFSVISPLGYTIDLLPFGDIEVEDGVSITGQGLVDTKVNGFKEVYDSGLVEIESEEGFSFSVASLEAIVMLKLIAFDDRAEQRPKDPGDVASIINHYFDLNLEDIYDNHNDLFVEHDGEEYSIQALSAQVIGRKLGSIILSSVKIRQRIKAILNTHIEQGEDATFIKRMVGPDCPDIETAVLWLTKLLIGMEEKI